MIDKDAEFLKRLLVSFKVEADEHLKGMCSGLLELEKGVLPERRVELIEIIFREAHSLKGAARAVNQVEIESLCQALESVFASVKKNDLPTSPGLFDLLQEALDLLAQVLPDVGAERTHEDKAQQRQLISRLEETVKNRIGETEKRGNGADEECLSDSPVPRFPASGEIPGSPVQEVSPVPPLADSPIHKTSTDTVRVSTARLTSVLLQSEEMLSAKLASSQRVLDMRSASSTFGAWKKEWGRVRPLVQELKLSG